MEKDKKISVDIPATHLWIYKKIRDKYGLRLVRTRDIIEMIRRTIYQIPKKYDYVILCELEGYNLLRKVDRFKCQILHNDCEAKLKKLEEYFFF